METLVMLPDFSGRTELVVWSCQPGRARASFAVQGAVADAHRLRSAKLLRLVRRTAVGSTLVRRDFGRGV